jgi:hypothetical protein
MLCYVLLAIFAQVIITVIVTSLKVPRITDGITPVRWMHEFKLTVQLPDTVLSDSGRETKGSGGGMKGGKEFIAKRFHIQDII